MADSFEILAQRTDAETFEAGEPIYRQGEQGTLLFLLLEGAIVLERDGNPVGEVRPGELFGEEGLLGSSVRPASATAHGVVRVVPIGPALYRHLVAQDGRFAWRVRSARRRRLASSAGAALVVLALATAGAAQAQLWEVGNQLIAFEETPAEGDLFGSALAVGDFDGDGNDDLAVGSANTDTITWFRGGVSGLTHWNFGGTNQAGSGFGAALATGDFDGDGRDELAIGAPNHDIKVPAVIADAGRVEIRERENGTWLSSAEFTQDSSGIPGGAEAGDHFGAALATGDFDDDGYDDLAIGVPFEAIGATGYAGAVNVIYGSATGLASTGAQVWYRSGGGIDGTAAFAFLGIALATGDFDGNGVTDLAIGASGSTIDLQTGAGEVVILFGDAGVGLTANGQQSFNATDFGRAAGDQEFGAALAAGDFDRDEACELAASCADDLAIGAPREAVAVLGGTATTAGRVYVVRGSQAAGGLDATSSQGFDQWLFFPTAGTAPESNDRFGQRLAAGELDQILGTDLVVGSPQEATNAGLFVGCADLLFGGLSDFNGNLTQHLESVPGYASAPAVQGDKFGSALAVGDFDGNGTGDLAIGLSNRTVDSVSEAGAVQVLFGALFADGFESNALTNWSNF